MKYLKVRIRDVWQQLTFNKHQYLATLEGTKPEHHIAICCDNHMGPFFAETTLYISEEEKERAIYSVPSKYRKNDMQNIQAWAEDWFNDHRIYLRRYFTEDECDAISYITFHLFTAGKAICISTLVSHPFNAALNRACRQDLYRIHIIDIPVFSSEHLSRVRLPWVC